MSIMRTHDEIWRDTLLWEEVRGINLGHKVVLADIQSLARVPELVPFGLQFTDGPSPVRAVVYDHSSAECVPPSVFQESSYRRLVLDAEVGCPEVDTFIDLGSQTNVVLEQGLSVEYGRYLFYNNHPESRPTFYLPLRGTAQHLPSIPPSVVFDPSG